MNIGDIASAGTVAGLMAAAVVWYHSFDQRSTFAPIQEQLGNIEADSVVSRINRLYRVKCQPDVTLAPDLEAILEQQLRRYHELTGRDFRPPC